MNIDTAKSAAALAAQIGALTTKLTELDSVIAEIQNSDGWELFECRLRAKATGSVQPQGSIVNCLPFGAANAENTLLAAQQARATYQAQLDELIAQLAKL